MINHKDRVASQAADNTSAINGIVGIQKLELMQSVAALVAGSIRHPKTISKRFAHFGGQLGAIVKGDSELAPMPRDRRFKDKAWEVNPIYKRGLQTWLAVREELKQWVDDAEIPEDDKKRAQFILDIATDTMAPTNFLLGNPAAMKRFYETGGTSILRGMKNAYQDLMVNGGMPKQVDVTPFTTGENIAGTEGAVVYKNEILELIQYKPSTESVYKIPMLICPPQINKYYVFDLTQKKSVVRFLTDRGYQVFMVSWRNPQKKHEHWNMDNYVQALIEASEAMLKITKSRKLNACGACSGGITLATFMSTLTARNDDRVNSFTLQVCVLDSRRSDSEIGLFLTDNAIEKARRKSKKDGMLKGKELAKSFAWMRPNDLIWNYVVNNYLMGDQPPAFDVLYWNSDTTNLPAALHSDYLDIYFDKRFQTESHVDFMGHEIDLTKVKQDGFVQGAITDHITPWKACYRNVGLFGGDVEFVLSNSGHIQSLVNPPGNPKAQFFRNSTNSESPDEWLETSEQLSDSWWLYWDKWLGKRSGEKKKAPRSLGNKSFPQISKAPGTYVMA